MHISPSAQRLLQLAFAAVSAAVTRPRLERDSGLSRADVNRALEELTRLGLLDVRRLRLTLPGLALAAACAARARPTPRAASAEPALHTPSALFSKREAPRAVA